MPGLEGVRRSQILPTRPMPCSTGAPRAGRSVDPRPVYEPARAAAQCPRDDQNMAGVTPPSACSGLRSSLPTGSQPAGRACSCCARSHCATRRRACRPGHAPSRAGRRARRRTARPAAGRCLGQAADICRIADLPELFSHPFLVALVGGGEVYWILLSCREARLLSWLMTPRL